MIPTVQFDPATLAIWTTSGTLPEPASSLSFAAMGAAARGENPAEALEALPKSEPVRNRILWLASCVWHEKRHFLDTCLTNYGAHRFRDLFNLAGCFGPLLSDARERGVPVWFPIEVYGCSVRRRILGIPEPAPNILEMARLARARKSLGAQLDATLHGGVHLGGEAQLEGLAQVSQTASIEHCFGIKEMLALTLEHTHRLPREGPYRAIEAVSGALGCARDEEGVTIINPCLGAALFVTALCGRFYGAGSRPQEDLVAPSPRLARMIDELGPKPGRFEMTDEEATSLVDDLARRLWGRTALEEIAADIDAMEEKMASTSAPWLAAEGLDVAFADFLELRRRLLSAVKEMGAASLQPRAFPTLWRDRLLPWHVVATPSGSEEEDGAVIVFGCTLNVPPGLEDVVPKSVVWGRLHEPPPARAESGFAPRARAAWLQMLERHGPRALLMLNGRRHRRMLPPELERSLDEIEELGIAVRFDPRFEWPEQRDQATRVREAVALADFAGRDSFICDVTDDEIGPTEAAVLTPWEFRRSPLLPVFRKGPLQDVMLVMDWSDWVVRRDLLE